MTNFIDTKPDQKGLLTQCCRLLILILSLQETSAAQNALQNTVPIGFGQTLNYSQSTTPVMLEAVYDQSNLGGANLPSATKWTLSMSFRVNTDVLQATLRGTLFTLMNPSGTSCSQGDRIAALTLMLNPGVAQVVMNENLQSILLPDRQARQLVNHWMFLLISFDYSTSNCYVHIFKYATMDVYQSVILNYPTISQSNFQVTNVNLILGSYFCRSSNSETTFSGEIRNIYWTLGSSLPDFSARHIYLLRYGGYTQVLSYYPVQEHEGDTVKDIISGNDGNLGAIQNYIGQTSDTYNPSRTTDANRKMPFLQYNNFLTINFPYMGMLGVDYSKFFIAFWFYGVFSQTLSNEWIFFSFNNVQLAQTTPNTMQFSCNAQVTSDSTTTFQDSSWISLVKIQNISNNQVAVFREQDDLIVGGYKQQNIEILRGQSISSTILVNTYINQTTCNTRPSGSIQFGGSLMPSTDSGFVISNIAIGKGSFVDDSSQSTIISSCQHQVVGHVNYCLKADVTSASLPQILNGALILQSACTQSAYANKIDMCERVCSYRCATCTSSRTCLTCAGNRINAPACSCPAYYINLEGQSYCLAMDKASDYAYSGLNDFNLQATPLTVAFPQTSSQVSNRNALFNYANYKGFPTSLLYNRIEIEAITRLDMTGPGFSLVKSWLSSQQIQETLNLQQNSVVSQLQTSHFIAASVGQYAQVTYNMNALMATVGASDTMKSQTITIEPQSGKYPSTLATPRAIVFLLGFEYISAPANVRLSIRVSVLNISPSKVDVVVTTNGLIGLQQITLSVALVRPDHYNYQKTLDLTSTDHSLMQTKFFSDSFVAPAQIPLGTPQVYGIQGFDLQLGTGGRITLDVQQTRYSTDRLTAYFDVSSWSDQKISYLDLASLWFVGDCTYTGESGSGCKNSFLYTDNSFTLPVNTCVCQSGFYNAGSFPFCRSCINGASTCSSETSYTCPANFRQENVCYTCHYSCATCLSFDQTCLTCSDGSRTLTTIGTYSYCPCSNGYIDNGVAVCIAGTTIVCDITCLTCNGVAANQCLSCSATSNRNIVGNSCICNANFYEYGMRNCMKSSCLSCSLQQISNYFYANSAIIEALSTNGVALTPQSTQAYSSTGPISINMVNSNLIPSSYLTHSSPTGQVGTTNQFSNIGDNYFTLVLSKTFTAAYFIRKETTSINFIHNVGSVSSNAYSSTSRVYTDKDIFKVSIFYSTSGGITLYNFVFVPQTPGINVGVSFSSTTPYLRYDSYVNVMNKNGIIYQLTFTEQSASPRTLSDLNNVAYQFLNIINNARQNCCDPLLNFMISVVDLSYDLVFQGISNNVKSSLINQDQRANNLNYGNPYSDINDITTDQGSSSVTYVWGVDGHEANFILGPTIGAIATRQYDNIYFNVMRIDTLNYLQVQNTYTNTQPLEVIEYQLWSKVSDELNYIAYIKMTRVFNSQAVPTMVTYNIFRDVAFQNSGISVFQYGNIAYQSFNSNKRSLQIFQNIKAYYRLYQLIFFGQNGYLFTQVELQAILDNFVALITSAVKFSIKINISQGCGLPNYGYMHNLVWSPTGFNGIQTKSLILGQNNCNSAQTSDPMIASLKVYSNGQTIPMPTARANRLTELPSQLGRLGKVQQILDQTSVLHLHYLLDKVSQLVFNFVLNAGTWTLTTITNTVITPDLETYYFYWFQFQYVTSTYNLVDYFVFFSNQPLTVTLFNGIQFGTLTVSSLTNVRELYFVSFGRYNGTLTTSSINQFQYNYINNIIYPAKHYFLHKCPSYNYQMVCGSCAAGFGDRSSQWCDSFQPDYLFGDSPSIAQTNNIFDDNLNFNGISSCAFYNNPLLDWTVWTSSYYINNPPCSHNNMNTWAIAGSTSLSSSTSSCQNCAQISTNLAPGVYLPYTISQFASRPDITGPFTRYYTQLNPNNFIAVIQLSGVTTLYIDTVVNTGPVVNSNNDIYQSGEIFGYDIDYYIFNRYSDSTNDDITYFIYIPQHLSTTQMTHQVNSATSSQMQINVQGVTLIYILCTVMNKANTANFNFQQYVDMQNNFDATIRALKPQSNSKCYCSLPNAMRDQNCIQSDDTSPSCFYQCGKCDIYAQSASYCTSCPVGSNRNLLSNQCTCQTGYYNVVNNPICQACHPTCPTCIDYKKCTPVCVTGQFRTFNVQTLICSCNPGYYDTGASICALCSSPCVTCFSQASQCTSCANTFEVSLIFNTCVCTDGYYSSGASCQLCNYQCQICTGGASNNCQVCLTGSYRALNIVTNQCPCNDGYYDANTAICVICSTPCLTCVGTATHCVTCSNGSYLNGQTCTVCVYQCLTCSGGTTSNCQSCQTGQFRTYDSINHSCNCNSGYYDPGSLLCSACVSPCVTCTSATACSSCPTNGYYLSSSTCLTCDHSCLACTNGTPTGCQTCLAGQHRTLNSVAHQCPCDAGFYDPNAVMCTVCIAPCVTCTSATACSSCPTNGYYLSSSTCLTCDHSCLACTDGTLNGCQTCLAGQHRTLNSVAHQCPCDAGYYDPNAVMCTVCISPCVTCTSATFCLSCPTNGYYLSGSTCLTCDHSCLACTDGTPNGCQTCLAGQHRTLNSVAHQCPCDAGYYDPNAVMCTVCIAPCVTCTSATFCLSCPTNGYYLSGSTCLTCDHSCLACTDGTPNGCQSCLAGQYRTLNSVAHQCPCNSGYYDVNVVLCTACVSPCVTCTTLTTCSSCIAIGYYLNGSACTNCNYSCYSCTSGTSSGCQSCLAGQNRTFKSSTHQCVCNSGYYDVGVVLCTLCVSPCITCTTLTTCQSCISIGYYLNGSTCTNCHYSCLTCTGGTSSNCQSCLTGQHRTLKPQLNQCTCDDGYFDTNILLCAPCTYPCSTCITLATNCYSCSSIGYYLNGLTCSLCDYSCLSCSNGDSNSCLSCSTGQNRSTALLTNQCPCNSGYYDAGVLLCVACVFPCVTCNSLRSCQSCSSGYYLDQFTCTPCNYQCLTCSSGNPNNCSSCKPMLNRTFQPLTSQCLCDSGYFDANMVQCAACNFPCTSCISTAIYCLTCASGYYLSASICSNCNAPCLTCSSGSADSCLSCVNGLNFNQLTNSCSCDKGYFNTITLLCSNCMTPCLTCTNIPTTCSSCSPGYYQNGYTCSTCNIQCSSCIGGAANTCVSCSAGSNRSLNNLTNQCTCDPGYFDENVAKCGLCSSPCKTCVNTDTNCLACNDGQYLSGSDCLNCDPQCQTCFGGDGNQCETCTSGQNRALDVSSQQCLCANGYFEQDVLVCTACSAPCMTCEHEATLCLSCNSGTHLSGWACITDVVCEIYPGLYTNPMGECDARCGDGIIRFDKREQCDDGNILSSDGCSSTCQVEQGFKCQQAQLYHNQRDNYTLAEYLFSSICTKAGPIATLSYINEDSNDELVLVFNENIVQKDFCKMYNLTIESLNSKELQFESTYLSASSCSIKLNYQVSLIQDKLIEVRFNGSLTDNNDQSLQTTEIHIQSRHFTYYSPIQIAQANQTVSFQKSLDKTFLILGAIALLLGGAQICSGLLDTMSWVTTLYQLNVNWPLNIQLFLRNAQWTNILYLKSPVDLNSSSQFYSRSEQKFHEKGMDGCFLASVQKDIEFCVGGVCVYLVSNLMCNLLERVYQKSQSSESNNLVGVNSISQQRVLDIQLPTILKPCYRLFKLINDNATVIFIKVLLLVNLDLQTGSILQLVAGNYGKHSFVSLNTMLALMVQASGAILPIYLFTIINKSSVLLDDEDYSHKYRSIYEDVKIDTPQGKCYCMLTVVKKTCYVYSMIFFYKQPLLQTICCTLIYSSNLLLICFVKLFDDRTNLFKSLIPQVGIFGSLATTIVLAIDEQTKTLSQDSRFFLGWVILSCVLSSITLQCVTMAYIVVKRMKEGVMSRFARSS